MKYTILTANSNTYNHYEWLEKEGKILWPFSNNFDFNENDLILLYSVEKKEIKYLLNAKKILKNSNSEKISAKMGEIELKKYKKLDWLKNRKSLFEMNLFKELDKSFTLEDILVKSVPQVLKHIKKENEKTFKSFEKIEKILSESFLLKKNYDKIFHLNEKETKKFFNEYEKIFKIRDSSNIKKIKEEFYLVNNSDKCEKCGFSFEEKIKEKYIEMHHKIPFREIKLKKEYKSLKEIKKDFEFLCSNCHKIADIKNK